MAETFYCAYCSQPNVLFVDPSAGRLQSYVEDCQVCCRPNVLTITWDEAQETYWIESMPESDWS